MDWSQVIVDQTVTVRTGNCFLTKVFVDSVEGFHKGLFNKPGASSLFTGEVKAMNSIQGDRTPKVLNPSIMVEGRNGFVMNFIQGEDSFSYLRSASEEKLCEWILQLLVALEDVHKAGYAHLDIKPQNTITGSDGKVSIVDFGSAQQFSNKSVSKGTHGYFSTNCQLASKPCSDLYSTLCCIINTRTPGIRSIESPEVRAKRLDDSWKRLVAPLINDPNTRILSDVGSFRDHFLTFTRNEGVYTN